MASFEQRAFEGLGNALKAMGYTGESLMKSFDMDGDSVLNYEEFKAGIAKTTGQNAPDPIIRAVFGMLDKDRDGAITYSEVLLLLGEKNPDLKEALETIGGKPTETQPKPKANQPKPTLILDPEFQTGEKIRVGFSYPGAEERSWIGLYGRGSNDMDYLEWLYLNGSQEQNYDTTTAGSLDFDLDIPPGDYEVRLFGDGGYDNLLASASTVVLAVPEPEPEVASVDYTMRERGSSENPMLDGVTRFVGHLGEAVTLTARKKAIDSLIGEVFPLAMKVSGLDRTIGYGISKELMFGTTVLATSALLGQVELRLSKDHAIPKLGQSIDMPVRVSGWNFAQNRPILEISKE